ncbi:MAG: G-D-S-L family lipolytic protein [Cyclobacteriaceae bacterium]|nr:G-D-S-L family lipolytic protein [Cyclobacteriaceae bacterium]
MRIIIFLIALCLSASLSAQDPARFQKEVDNLVNSDSSVHHRKLILFTGSSSIRFWKSLATDFPNHHTLNRGFGGSEMSDLLFYAEQLVIKHKPKEIFIYEGDNDINSGKSPHEILETADQLLSLIRARLPNHVKVIFISAKPSLARWHLKETYIAYNQQLKAWTNQHKKVSFVDVWTPMLDAQGVVLKDIFMEDGLHLNAKGYKIWADTIREFL